ncbi:hypothetical protein [Pantoea ananatis]|uniref:hypothetical protein n=1 Tax=Pantoea ananas TaxID=553 RepID=UPI0002323167|nr:hypothetical protein [Pantoea ananatis]AER32340.1 hypothetical protein PAGR_g1825 [Pantoea ananatis PA13]
MNYIYQLLIGLLSGSFAAWLTTFLALRRFYNEKWWEKRASAFIEITDAVYKIKTEYEYYCDRTEFRRAPDEFPNFILLDETRMAEMQSESSKAMSVINKYSQVGPLLITQQVSNLLSNYLKAERKINNEVYFEGLDADEAEANLLEITSKLLLDLVLASKKELKSD